MHTRDTTRHFKFLVPERDDLIDITTALNQAYDLIDARIGSITQSDWTVNTAFSNLGHTASAEECRTRKFNKTQWQNVHITISTVSSGSTGIEFLPGGMGGYILSGEPDYQDSGFDSPGPFDVVGAGVAYDTSLNQYHHVRVLTSASNSGRLRLETGASNAVNNTNPFTWAAGDFLSVEWTLQAFGDG